MYDVVFEGDGKLTIRADDENLLRASLAAGFAHHNDCGGQGRCSTCRVLILEGLDNVVPRNEAEVALAERLGLDDCVRLACQSRVRGPVTLRRLIRDETDLALCHHDNRAAELQLAILFADIRSFTSFSARQLPYDVVHILNRYFNTVGQAVLDHHGTIDKYMGDGIMALFGLGGRGPRRACEDAVAAAVQMIAGMDDLNDYLRAYFDEEFRIGVGVHVGTVVVGDLGHRDHRQFTAIGDPVNVAARIEAATKVAEHPVLVSDSVVKELGASAAGWPTVDLELKGKTGSFRLHKVPLRIGH